MKEGGIQGMEGGCRRVSPREGGETPFPAGWEKAVPTRKDEVKLRGGGEWNTG